MRLRSNIASTVAIVLTTSTVAVADDAVIGESGAQFAVKSEIYLQLDCETPRLVKDFKVEADFQGSVNSKSEGRADLTIHLAPMLSARIPFVGKVNGPPHVAPGGSTSIRSLGPGKFDMIWDLPNNSLHLSIDLNKEICTARISVSRKSGANQYTLFADTMYYCSKVVALGATCRYN